MGNATFCAIDCVPSTWGNWGSCSESCCERGPAWAPTNNPNCGTSTRSRGRTQVAKHGGKDCPELGFDLNQSTPCDEGICHRDCELGCVNTTGDCTSDGWHTWGSCSLSCRDTLGDDQAGMRMRTRDLLKPHSHPDQYLCDPVNETEPCNDHECEITCIVSEWGSWEPCSYHATDCPAGSVRRTRSVTRQPQYGASEECLATSYLQETQKWTSLPSADCESPKQVTGQWSSCDKHCNSGHQYRYVVHSMCSEQSVLKIHMKFRQGKSCSTQTCSDGQTELKAETPEIPDVTSDVFPASNLDEELGKWQKLSTQEALANGLEPDMWHVQEWQKPLLAQPL